MRTLQIVGVTYTNKWITDRYTGTRRNYPSDYNIITNTATGCVFNYLGNVSLSGLMLSSTNTKTTCGSNFTHIIYGDLIIKNLDLTTFGGKNYVFSVLGTIYNSESIVPPGFSFISLPYPQAVELPKIYSQTNSLSGSSFDLQTFCTTKYGNRNSRVEIKDNELNKTFNHISLKITPNPVQSKATIYYELPQNSSSVHLTVYDAMGNMVLSVLKNEIVEAGSFQYEIEEGILPKGLYIVRLTSENESKSVKMIVE